jgi:serine phosphatase RsbU (regulator of sigma subunit)
MLDSLHYAEMIQQSLLPGLDRMKTESPDSLIIWIPKDIVGGDIFYMFSHPESSVVALMDCTGHGVPGAFLTMIAYTEIRRIILDQGCHDPAEILKRLNLLMKNALHKGKEKQMVDDGLDAAVIEVNHTKSCFRFAGARIPLCYIKVDQVMMIIGD